MALEVDREALQLELVRRTWLTPGSHLILHRICTRWCASPSVHPPCTGFTPDGWGLNGKGRRDPIRAPRGHSAGLGRGVCATLLHPIRAWRGSSLRSAAGCG